jgi:hypothetical protein
MTASALNTFVTGRDRHGGLFHIVPAPNHTDQVVFASAGAVTTLQVPAGADVVVFGWNGGNIQVKPIAASNLSPPASAPTGAVSDGSAWEINPTGYFLRNLPGAQAIGSLQIECDAANVTLTASFYCLENVP